jgi:hypothetical protein
MRLTHRTSGPVALLLRACAALAVLALLLALAAAALEPSPYEPVAGTPLPLALTRAASVGVRSVALCAAHVALLLLLLRGARGVWRRGGGLSAGRRERP